MGMYSWGPFRGRPGWWVGVGGGWVNLCENVNRKTYIYITTNVSHSGTSIVP